MKPTTGRPWKVCAAAEVTPVTMLVVRVPAATADVRPTPVAFVPVKPTSAQPFWNVEVTLTLVTFDEPRTSEVEVAPAVGAFVEALRKLRTVDSQHSAFGAPPGCVGEKSTVLAPAPRSSRLKKVSAIVSHAPLAVRTFVNGGVAVTELTNLLLVGNVKTQSVSESVAASRMYSFSTSECIIVADAACPPAVAMNGTAVPAHVERYTSDGSAFAPATTTTMLEAGLVALKFGLSLPISVYTCVALHKPNAFALYIVSRPEFTLISVPVPMRPPVGGNRKGARATTRPVRPVQVVTPVEALWVAASAGVEPATSVAISN